MQSVKARHLGMQLSRYLGIRWNPIDDPARVNSMPVRATPAAVNRRVADKRSIVSNWLPIRQKRTAPTLLGPRATTTRERASRRRRRRIHRETRGGRTSIASRGDTTSHATNIFANTSFDISGDGLRHSHLPRRTMRHGRGRLPRDRTRLLRRDKVVARHRGIREDIPP